MDNRRIADCAGPPREIATAVTYDDNRRMAELLGVPAAYADAMRRARSPVGGP